MPNSPTPEELNDPRLDLSPKKPKPFSQTYEGRRAATLRKRALEGGERVSKRRPSRPNEAALKEEIKKDEEARLKKKGILARAYHEPATEDYKSQQVEKNGAIPLPFTLGYFIAQFVPGDPFKSNEVAHYLCQQIAGDDPKIKEIVERYEKFERGPKGDPRIFEKLCKATNMAQAALAGGLTYAALRMGRNIAVLSIATTLQEVVEATAKFGKKKAEAHSDRELMFRAGGLVQDKSGSSINFNQISNNVDARTQNNVINSGMQLPRLSDTTGEIHSQVMEERRRMLDKPDLSGVIEVEKREGEEVYESQTVR